MVTVAKFSVEKCCFEQFHANLVSETKTGIREAVELNSPAAFLMSQKEPAMKAYVHRPKHPDVIAGLNDAAILRNLAARVDELTTEPRTHTAQAALIEAHAVLVAAAKTLTP